MEKRAIIIGAGPAGLTAAYELLKRTDIKPVILEKSGDIGGISKTVNYKGNRIDIGGHRFFSKSDRVMNWWMNIMPVEESQKKAFNITYQNKSRKVDLSNEANNGAAIADPDKVMLVRPRLSRIYFLRKFFTYPIQLSIDTLRKLGLSTTISIMFSYLKAQLSPRRPEKNLEDFMINRFGQVLYKLFFKDYTQKVWGVPCQDIPAEWGAQRIKGVSIAKAIQHAIQSATKRNATGDISQKATETSLIEQFLYPKYGPGQLWEEVARQVESMGGIIHMNHVVEHVYNSADSTRVTAIAAVNTLTGESLYLEGDYFFSTMPVKELIAAVDGAVPEDVKEIAAGLQYRDFITVGILLRRLSSLDERTGEWKPLELKDTWIYIQESDVKVGRLQIFNNWSPYMVKDPDTVWIGMEFFCDSTDSFWNKSDAELKALAVNELEKIGLANSENVLDTTVIRMEKTYPAYFGTYDKFEIVKEFLDRYKNLFLVGRNGMHKYNNSDHSMLTAMVAVDNIISGTNNKDNIWEINTEQEYHEEKASNPEIDNDNARTNSKGHNRKSKSYIYELMTNKTNQYIVAISLLAIITQFFVFKKLFPFANYMPDSYSYIDAAYRNAAINTWPIGYSKFLRVFSSFFQSDKVLVFFQYLFLQLSIIYFVLTICHSTKASNIVKVSTILCFVFNPLILLISNYISADSIFTGVSLIWLAEMVRFVIRPSEKLAYTISTLLILAFIMRYNALYYPLITISVLFFSGASKWIRLKAMALVLVLLGSFVWLDANRYYNISGHKQFSAFSGWQLGSNALFMYSKVDDTKKEKMPHKFEDLDRYVKHYIDSLKTLTKRPDSTLGIFYLWDGPLKKYAFDHSMSQSYNSDFAIWSSYAPLYANYGLYLISRHPTDFFNYFIIPNTINYFSPPPEFAAIYNMKRDSVGKLAEMWFGYKSNKVSSFSQEIKLVKIFPSLNTAINLALILGTLGFLIFNGLRSVDRKTLNIYLIIEAIWVLNFIFSVLASPIVLRYQLFSMVISILLAMIFFEYLIKVSKTTDSTAFDK